METAHNKTDKMLMNLKKKNKNRFLEAFKRIRNIIANAYISMGISETMTAQERIDIAKKYGKVDKLINEVVEDLQTTNEEAIKEINTTLKEIYQLNYNSMANDLKSDGYDLETLNKSETKEEMSLDENPFNVIAIKKLSDKKNIEREVMNSVYKGILEDIGGTKAVTGLKNVYEKNLSSCNSIALNQTTFIENTARQRAFESAEKLVEKDGGVLIKVWHSQRDERVRYAHSRANGQKAEVDRPFVVGGEELMFPRDLNGSPENTMGCRCYISYEIVKK